MIKEKKILTINKETKKILGNYFKDEKNKNILLKIFNQDELDTFINVNEKLIKKDNNNNNIEKRENKQNYESKKKEKYEKRTKKRKNIILYLMTIKIKIKMKKEIN